MPDSTGLIAISFLGVGGFWVNLYIGGTANEMGLKIYGLLLCPCRGRRRSPLR